MTAADRIATMTRHGLANAADIHAAAEATEWAVQCHTSDSKLHTGRPFPTREQAEESGARLTQINGAEWWVVSRTVTTCAPRVTDWSRGDV